MMLRVLIAALSCLLATGCMTTRPDPADSVRDALLNYAGQFTGTSMGLMDTTPTYHGPVRYTGAANVCARDNLAFIRDGRGRVTRVIVHESFALLPGSFEADLSGNTDEGWELLDPMCRRSVEDLSFFHARDVDTAVLGGEVLKALIALEGTCGAIPCTPGAAEVLSRLQEDTLSAVTTCPAMPNCLRIEVGHGFETQQFDVAYDLAVAPAHRVDILAVDGRTISRVE